MKYMGYTLRKGAPGKKAKPLIPELMRAFGVSRRTVARALNSMQRRPAAARAAGVGGYGDLLAKAHAQAKTSPQAAVRDVDTELQRALLDWLTRSLKKRTDSTELAKVLLGILRDTK